MDADRPSDGEESLERRARAGDPDAQWQLGCLRLADRDEGEPLEAGFRWLASAAQRSPERAERLAMWILHGEMGLSPSTDAAIPWLRKAAAAGRGPAQRLLGVLLLREIDGPARVAEAERLLRSAAASGVDQAVLDLAAVAWLVRSDLRRAERFARLALLRGVPDAPLFLEGMRHRRRVRAALGQGRRPASPRRRRRVGRSRGGLPLGPRPPRRDRRREATRRPGSPGSSARSRPSTPTRASSAPSPMRSPRAGPRTTPPRTPSSPPRRAPATPWRRSPRGGSGRPACARAASRAPETWYERAAATVPWAAFALVSGMERSGGSSPAAVAHLRRAAALSDPRAQFELCMRAYGGYGGVPEDRAVALEFLGLARAQGMPSAHAFSGLLAEVGNGDAPDLERAVAHYRDGVKGGNPVAMGRLGECCWDGRGTPKDRRAAIRWFRRGAVAGDPVAALGLGRALCLGEGVRRDRLGAVRWLEQAASGGQNRAYGWIGRCWFEEGEDRPGAIPASVRWFRRGVAAGDPESEVGLAICHLLGAGVRRSPRKALALFRLAKSHGHGGADRGIEAAERALRSR